MQTHIVCTIHFTGNELSSNKHIHLKILTSTQVAKTTFLLFVYINKGQSETRFSADLSFLFRSYTTVIATGDAKSSAY